MKDKTTVARESNIEGGGGLFERIGGHIKRMAAEKNSPGVRRRVVTPEGTMTISYPTALGVHMGELPSISMQLSLQGEFRITHAAVRPGGVREQRNLVVLGEQTFEIVRGKSKPRIYRVEQVKGEEITTIKRLSELTRKQDARKMKEIQIVSTEASKRAMRILDTIAQEEVQAREVLRDIRDRVDRLGAKSVTVPLIASGTTSELSVFKFSQGGTGKGEYTVIQRVVKQYGETLSNAALVVDTGNVLGTDKGGATYDANIVSGKLGLSNTFPPADALEKARATAVNIRQELAAAKIRADLRVRLASMTPLEHFGIPRNFAVLIFPSHPFV